MDGELFFTSKRTKKKVENTLDIRNEFIVDKIFQNEIFVSGTRYVGTFARTFMIGFYICNKE